MATVTLHQQPKVADPTPPQQVPSTAIYSISTFVGAFLLFQVQSIIARSIMPWFGGTFGVWATCLLFFQAVLLGGYVYAHWISTRLQHAAARIHQGLIAASALLLVIAAFFWRAPILPSAAWTAQTHIAPVFGILGLLSLAVGFPFFLLSTTGPLVQKWFANAHPGTSPYRLYSLSNLGSLLGLLTYPFVFEPWLSLTTQAWLWCAGYAVYAVAVFICSRKGFITQSSELPAVRSSRRAAAETAPGRKQIALWIALPACASIVLLGITETICQEIAVVPLLWVLPLSVYLLSFIISFDHERWYKRSFFHFLLGAVVLAGLLIQSGGLLSHWFTVGFLLLLLFACCMVCHGEVYRSRPAAQHLTSFYLSVALGGMLGGVFVNLVAPLIFTGYWELHVGVFGCFAAMVWLALNDKQSWVYRSVLWLPIAILLWGYWTAQYTTDTSDPDFGVFIRMWQNQVLLGLAVLVSVLALLKVRIGKDAAKYGDAENTVPRLIRISLVIAVLFVGANLWYLAAMQYSGTLWAYRNFYGVLHARKLPMPDPRFNSHILIHGRIRHGLQMQARELRHLPASYFAPGSGVGLMLLNHPRRQAQPRGALRVGVIGLGIGTLAAYGEPGDVFRFYEINPAVIDVATKSPYFSFIRDCRAQVQIIEGDARISLERELAAGQPQQYDVLVVDAFNSDSIPVHLLTEEAFKVYLRHLRGPDSVIAFHISNNMLKLAPVITGQVQHFKLHSAHIQNVSWATVFFSESEWMLVSANPKVLEQPAILKASSPPPVRNIRLWTDEYSSVLRLF